MHRFQSLPRDTCLPPKPESPSPPAISMSAVSSQIPADVFPEAIDYLALGHIHGRQLIGGIETRCYCGAPIPFDFSEAALERSVTIVDTDARTCKPRRIPVPAFDRLVSLQGTPQELLDAIRKLKKNSNTALEVFCEAHCTVAGSR